MPDPRGSHALDPVSADDVRAPRCATAFPGCRANTVQGPFEAQLLVARPGHDEQESAWCMYAVEVDVERGARRCVTTDDQLAVGLGISGCRAACSCADCDQCEQQRDPLAVWRHLRSLWNNGDLRRRSEMGQGAQSRTMSHMDGLLQPRATVSESTGTRWIQRSS